MYEDILLATNGGVASIRATEHALELAADRARLLDDLDIAVEREATLHALFVAKDGLAPSGMVGRDHEDAERSDMVGQEHDAQSSGMTYEERDLDAIEQHGQRIVNDVAEAVSDDISTETAVLRGTPYESILDYADDNAVDLIVMGTHGRTGVDRYLLGSVTEKVVRTADVPVLTVRMEES